MWQFSRFRAGSASAARMRPGGRAGALAFQDKVSDPAFAQSAALVVARNVPAVRVVVPV